VDHDHSLGLDNNTLRISLSSIGTRWHVGEYKTWNTVGSTVDGKNCFCFMNRCFDCFTTSPRKSLHISPKHSHFFTYIAA
jgi:hypothetical protein